MSLEGFWKTLKKPFLALAPMEGVTDTVFRQMIAKLGKPDVYYTEFANVNGICSEGFEKVAERLLFTDAERPIVAQIWGTEPELFYKSAKLLSQMNFEGIDINFGCPVREVIKIGGGAAVITNNRESQKQVAEIISATNEGAKLLPISVKTRIGNKQVMTEDWIGFLLEQKLAALTVHGRLAKEMSKKPADWEEIGKAVKLKQQMKSETLILGNGDVKSWNQAQELATKYGVDGVMIGRGVFENPTIFNKQGGELSKAERYRWLREHALLYESCWQGKKPFVEIRKSVKMYISGFEKAAEIRQKLMLAENATELLQLLIELE